MRSTNCLQLKTWFWFCHFCGSSHPILLCFARCITKTHHSAMLMLKHKEGEGTRIGSLLGKQHHCILLHSRMLREGMRPWQQQRDGWGLPRRKYREIPLPSSTYATDGGSRGDPRLLSASSQVCFHTYT